jgi:hypothetical protein
VIGTSQDSPVGNGAVIVTNPDAPLNLADVPLVTSGTQIGLSWTDGLANGGGAVLDYRISSAEITGSYSVLATNVLTKSYTALGLTAGTSYKFKVEARNSYGYSTASNEVTILAAEAPARPIAPTTAVSGNSVIISWSEPATNGSPIIGYSISILAKDGLFYIDSA